MDEDKSTEWPVFNEAEVTTDSQTPSVWYN